MNSIAHKMKRFSSEENNLPKTNYQHGEMLKK